VVLLKIIGNIRGDFAWSCKNFFRACVCGRFWWIWSFFFLCPIGAHFGESRKTRGCRHTGQKKQKKLIPRLFLKIEKYTREWMTIWKKRLLDIINNNIVTSTNLRWIHQSGIFLCHFPDYFILFFIIHLKRIKNLKILKNSPTDQTLIL